MEAIGALIGLLGSIAILWAPAALVFCAVVSGSAAHDKGRPQASWFLAGLLFGPLSLLAIAACGPRAPARGPNTWAEPKIGAVRQSIRHSIEQDAIDRR